MSQVGATCYSSDAAAVSAMASAEVGKVVPAGASVYVVNAVPASDASITYTLTPLDATAPITYTVAVTVQPCGLIDWADSLAVSWLVGGCWLLAAAVLTLRRAR